MVNFYLWYFLFFFCFLGMLMSANEVNKRGKEKLAEIKSKAPVSQLMNELD